MAATGDGSRAGACAAGSPPGAATPSRQARLWHRFGWLFAAVWLVFLLDPLADAWRDRDHVAGVASIGALCAFSVLYVRALAFRGERRDAFGWAVVVPARSAWTTLAVLAGLAALAFPGAGLSAAATFVFLAVYSIFSLPLRTAAPLVVASTATCLVLGLVVPGWSLLASIALSMLLAGLAVVGATSTARRGRQLALAQQDLARLAVAEERGRFARDFHDLLGHSLTVVTLKAELAGRLLEAGPQESTAERLARAAAEVADIERLARDALQDVRAALEGYREVSLGAELAGARQALAAAGVEAHLPGAVDDVPEDARELFGWVVREGVTNVVRHSGARRCWIELDAGAITVSDDGRGPSSTSASGAAGSGLRGLADRATAAGAVMTVGRSDAGGFSVRVRVAPVPAPLLRPAGAPARSPAPARRAPAGTSP